MYNLYRQSFEIRSRLDYEVKNIGFTNYIRLGSYYIDMNKIDSWPCHKYGHRIPIKHIQTAYLGSVCDSETSIKCARCQKSVEITELQHPIVKTGQMQHNLLHPSATLGVLSESLRLSD